MIIQPYIRVSFMVAQICFVHRNFYALVIVAQKWAKFDIYLVCARRFTVSFLQQVLQKATNEPAKPPA